MNREEKNTELNLLTDCLTRSQIAICADYRGLSVAKITELRRELQKVGAKGRVVKNTLTKIAFGRALSGGNEKETEKFVETLVGPTMMIYSFEDPIAPTKVTAAFAKANEALKVKSAFLEGAFVDPAGVDALSKMPGRAEVLAQLLRLIQTPATNLVRLLQAPGSQLVRVVEAHREKLAGGEEG